MALVITTEENSGGSALDLNGTNSKLLTGASVLAYNNTTGRDLYVSPQAWIGIDGGNELTTNSAITFNFTTVINDGGLPNAAPAAATDIFKVRVSETQISATHTLHFHSAEPFLLPSGWGMRLFVFSDDVNDTGVDTICDLVDVQAGIDVRAVSGATPMSTANVQTSCESAHQTYSLDKLIAVDTGVAADGDLSGIIIAGAILSHLMAAGADAAGYKASTDALEAVYDKLAAMFSAATLANIKSEFDKH